MTKANHVSIDPIAHLWLIARAWLADAIHAFGAPAEVARALSRFARYGLARRLRALETLVMKLLLVEAARLVVPPASSRHANTKTIAAKRTDIAGWKPAVREPDPARPETWRVRFELRIPLEAAHDTAVAPARIASPRDTRSAPDPARERAKAEKLARRFEALRRAIANPLPRARRLKRKLLALGARAYDAAMRIAIRRPPHDELDPTLHSRAQFAACSAVPALVAPDSS